MIEKQSIDYEAVLADLEERRSGLDSAIAAIKQIIQQGSASGVSPATSSIGINGQNIPGDAFFQMSIVDAAKKYLRIVKKKQSTRQIADALEKGGLTHSSKNFFATVSTVLTRQSKGDGDIAKIKKEWGLSEWYPGMKRGKTGTNKTDNIEEDNDKTPENEIPK